MTEDLEAKIKELSEYLDDDAIAQAFRITPEAVRDILEGRADLTRLDPVDLGDLEQRPTIQVRSVKTAYRQRVISIYRTKGGVGATSAAIGLAYLLCKDIRVLLVDLNFQVGGSDLSYYLTLPEYPSWQDFNGSLQGCIIPYEPTLHIIQPPRYAGQLDPAVEQIISYARQDYDAIIFDLPKDHEAWAKEALNLSNTLLVMTHGGLGELSRLSIGLKQYRHKEKVIILNQYKQPRDLVETIFPEQKVWFLENDHSAREALEKGEPPRLKSTFMKDLKQVAKSLFQEEEKKGFLGALLGG